MPTRLSPCWLGPRFRASRRPFVAPVPPAFGEVAPPAPSLPAGLSSACALSSAKASQHLPAHRRVSRPRVPSGCWPPTGPDFVILLARRQPRYGGAQGRHGPTLAGPGERGNGGGL